MTIYQYVKIQYDIGFNIYTITKLLTMNLNINSHSFHSCDMIVRSLLQITLLMLVQTYASLVSVIIEV